MNTSPTNPTIVLVHGAWADGSSWSQVIALLQAEGLKVVAAPIPLTSLRDDIAALDRVLERAEGPLLLAAHAYAGAVIAGTTNDRVQGLVFVAALAPDEGETVAEVFYREPPHPEAPQLAPDGHGLIWMPDDGFGKAFAQNAAAEQVGIFKAVQRPIAVACIQEPSPPPLWRSVRSWFLVAEQDRMISPATQRFMAARMGAQIRSEPVDHTPIATAPDAVVELILEAAGTA